MVGTRQLAAVSDLVEAAGGKLILIGDHRQLAEIDAGGVFAALTRRIPVVELTENVRQEHEWERDALSDLRHGSVERAVAAYRRHGRIATVPANEIVERACGNWFGDVTESGDPAAVLLIADTNATVDALNRRARQLVAEAGLLAGAAVVAGERMFQMGDRVVCRKNRTGLGVLNGDLAIVRAADPDARTVTLELDRDPAPVTIPTGYLDDGHLDWGYALTGHKAQGTTVERTHTVTDGNVDRDWLYVALSRGRHTNTMYLTDRTETPGLCDQCDHVTHDQVSSLVALVRSLNGDRTEVAASDVGDRPFLDPNDPDPSGRGRNLRASHNDDTRPAATLERLVSYRDSPSRDRIIGRGVGR